MAATTTTNTRLYTPIALPACSELGEFGDCGTRISRTPLSRDGYDPERDSIAPISLRGSFMELLWVCGDCGEHYGRRQSCPDRCDACGAPKQHFYAPVED